MSYPIPLTLFLVGLSLFVVFIFVSRLLYFKKHETKYSLLRMFPYEFNYPNVFKDNLYGNLLLILGALATMAFYDFASFKDVYSYARIVISILITMFIIVLLLMPLKYLRSHIVISILTMVLTFALMAFNFLTAFGIFKNETYELNQVVPIISMVISALAAVTMLVVIINPKMTYQIYAKKTIDENGNERLERPNVIVAALSEWITMIVYFLSPLPILFLLFFI